MILLDTHVLVHFMLNDPQLGHAAAERIAASLEPGSVLISPISAWEIGMLREKGRMALDRPTADWFRYVLSDEIVRLVGIDVAIAADAGHLSRDAIHGDPADRILIATARCHSVPLLTADRKILDCAAAGHLEAIDARL